MQRLTAFGRFVLVLALVGVLPGSGATGRLAGAARRSGLDAGQLRGLPAEADAPRSRTRAAAAADSRVAPPHGGVLARIPSVPALEGAGRASRASQAVPPGVEAHAALVRGPPARLRLL